jgi:hypothetical protein
MRFFILDYLNSGYLAFLPQAWFRFFAPSGGQPSPAEPFPLPFPKCFSCHKTCLRSLVRLKVMNVNRFDD